MVRPHRVYLEASKSRQQYSDSGATVSYCIVTQLCSWWALSRVVKAVGRYYSYFFWGSRVSQENSQLWQKENCKIVMRWNTGAEETDVTGRLVYTLIWTSQRNLFRIVRLMMAMLKSSNLKNKKKCKLLVYESIIPTLYCLSSSSSAHSLHCWCWDKSQVKIKLFSILTSLH